MTTPTSPNPSSGWLRDEVDSAGRENLDPDHVARYDAKEDSGAPGEVSLLQALGMGPESVVVELGAGTGQFAIAAAPHVRRVVAVDVSPVMLDRLRSKLRGLRIDNIDVVEAGYLTYDHTGPPEDVVYSRYALHHLPDFWKALALERARAMLRSDGILRLWDVVYSFEPAEAVDRIEAWCATGGDDVDADWSRAELEEHVRDEHSTYSWLLEPMLDRVGFTIETVEHSRDGMFARYVARARSVDPEVDP